MSWPIELSKTFSKPGTADVFGVIVYTDANVHVKKVLDDEDYWNALDEISGPCWAVFATRAAKGHYGLPNLPPNQIGFLVPVWKEPRVNRDLIELFELGSTEKLPVVVCFSKRRDETIVRTVIGFSDESKEEAFASLKKVFESVANALDRREYDRLSSEISDFEAVNRAIRTLRVWESVQKGAQIWRWLVSFKP